MSISRLEYLFDCFVYRKSSLKQEEELMELLDQEENAATVQLLIEKFIETSRSEDEMPEHRATSILENILQKEKAKVIPFNNKKKAFLVWTRVAAAAVLLLVSTTLWKFLRESKNHEKSNLTTIAGKPLDVLTGGNHAILTMPDGSTIILDTIKNGKISYANAKINKQKGILIFNATASVDPGTPVAYNTLSTPSGSKYQVILPDGSKVWLNASSSLKFPTAFSGKQREVQLTGEGYFEVAIDKEKPFKVKVDQMEIKVLGTHFNIKAYDDEEAIKTTLLEGSVKITKGKNTDFLIPGQQGVVNKKEDKIAIKEVDMKQVMAWKNGLFQFEGADISTIMREISRWYNVEIVYSDKMPARRFEGKISRDAQLSEVLRILELSSVKFRVSGNKIIVQ